MAAVHCGVPWNCYCNFASTSDAMDWFALDAGEGEQQLNWDQFTLIWILLIAILEKLTNGGHPLVIFVSWYYGLEMAILAIAAPSLPCIFGITALFLSRLGLMVVGGLVLASFMTYASEHLAIRKTGT
ncbi:hypothetical protein DITRI_Ditri20bG0044700 [Diplodiscus trichospermus]